MPDISLLEPRVLNGVIERFVAPDGMLGHTIVPRQSYPETHWEYDIVKGRRRVARPNTPNSPAHIVGGGQVGKMAGSFVLTREKKVFEPTTLRWLREPGTFAEKAAEREVLREMQDLVLRVDRWEEYLIWKMLGTGAINLTAMGFPVSVDFQVQNTHMPTMSTFWTDPAADVIGDLQDMNLIMNRDAGTELTRFIGNSVTINAYYRNFQIQSSLNDAQKGAYAMSGVIPSFQGVSFIKYDRGYEDDFTNPAAVTWTPYIPDGYLIGITDGGPDTFVYLDGLLADDEAPIGATGRFAKTWKEKDPSNRQILLESNGFPVLKQPDALMIARIF